ncbi:MAG: PAS domain S-box protein [Acidobacteria bacterium]|nr:PAS domain S-box protein [Acidobacteriota bacterium]
MEYDLNGSVCFPRAGSGYVLEHTLAQIARPALIADQSGLIRWGNATFREQPGMDDAAIAGGRVRVRFGEVAIVTLDGVVSRAGQWISFPVGDGSGDVVGIGVGGVAEMVCRIDADGKVKKVSRVLGLALGWNEGEASGRPLEALFAAEDWPQVKAAVEQAVKADAGECVVTAGLVTGIAAKLTAEVRIEIPDREEGLAQRLFHSTPDALAILSVDRNGLWRYGKVNDAFCKAVGLARDEVWQRTPEQVFGDSYGTAVSRACMRCAAEVGSIDVGDGNMAAGGILWNLKVVPLPDGEGPIRDVVSVCWDVTARVGREEPQRMREEMLNSVLQLQTELISRTTKDGRFVFANAACCRFLGRTMEELKDERWERTVVEEDLDAVRRVKEQLSREAPIGVLEVRRYSGDGEMRWMDYQFVGVFDELGELVEVISAGRDVTARKQMEERLAQASAELKATADLTPGLLWRFGGDGRLVSVGGSCEQVLGYRPEEMAGGLGDWFGERKISEFVEGGPAVLFRHCVRARDGREVWLATSARLLEGEVRAASIDVTDRVIAEQKLEAERRFLSTLFATMSQGVVYQNAVGDVERANPAAEQVLGLTVEQMQGRNSTDPRWHTIHEDGSPLAGEDHPAMEALRSGKAVVNFLLGVHNPAEGGVRWLRVNAIPRYEAGEAKPSGVYTVFSDVTAMREARKQLEEKETILRLALEASKSGLWYWDLASNKGFLSPQYLEILGLEQPDMERWVEELFDYVHPDEVGLVREQLGKCVAGEQKSFSLIHRMLHRSGRVVWVVASGVVIDKSNGRTFPVMAGTIRDISELVEARQMAEKYAERRRSFLANMSHEIRTPMNGIVGLADLLGATELNQEQRQMVTNIQRCGNSLVALVNDILDLSKIEAGKVSMERIEFELAALLEEALETVGANAIAKGLQVRSEVAESLPLTAIGDPNRLRQVMVNLLSNAVKFSVSGTVRVEMDGEASEGKVRLSVKVSDTGIGMTAEQTRKLFRAFEQAERSTTRLFGGTGLGLSISKQLVELMGGQIEVVSEPGVGSTFQFTVWLQAAEAWEPSARATRGASVLVMAGEGWERSLRVRQLERLGHRVVADSCCDVVLLAPGSVAEMREYGRRLEWDEELRGKRWLLIAPPDWRRGCLDRQVLLGGVQQLGRPLSGLRLAEAVEVAAYGDWRHDEGRGAAAIGSGRRILVVEDNAVNRLVAGKMLERMGCVVSFAGDGLDAVEQVESGEAFDLVLMDCQMPKMDGLEATRRIRAGGERTRGVPIVALSAGVLAEEKHACYQCGMDEFLAKPISVEELHRVLGHFLTPV